jgi:hypothetical protein
MVPANDLVWPPHDRMPAVMPAEHVDACFDPEQRDQAKLLPLLRPYPGEGMERRPVDRRVNKVGVDEPGADGRGSLGCSTRRCSTATYWSTGKGVKRRRPGHTTRGVGVRVGRGVSSDPTVPASCPGTRAAPGRSAERTNLQPRAPVPATWHRLPTSSHALELSRRGCSTVGRGHRGAVGPAVVSYASQVKPAGLESHLQSVCAPEPAKAGTPTRRYFLGTVSDRPAGPSGGVTRVGNR